MKLGVVMASRGLVFSRTMESVFQNLKGKDFELYMSHDLPLPKCFNVPLNKALKDKCDYIWFIEEDMLILEGTLDKMIEMIKDGSKVVSVDYPNKHNGESFVCETNSGEILYTGMGCMLVDSKVFKELYKPYIQQGTFWIKRDDTNDIYLEHHPEIPQKGYGTQDVHFCWSVRQLGYSIDLVDSKVGHMKLVEKSEDNTNNGQHTIDIVYL